MWFIHCMIRHFSRLRRSLAWPLAFTGPLALTGLRESTGPGTVLAWVTLACSGCIVPAPVDPVVQVLQPTLIIQKNSLHPLPFSQIIISRATKEGFEFKTSGAVRAIATKLPLHYHWYYDYGSKTSVLASTKVGNEERCRLFVCDKVSYTKDEHTLTLVVSDQALKEGVQEPTNFPVGAVFDTVSWPILLSDSCAVGP